MPPAVLQENHATTWTEHARARAGREGSNLDASPPRGGSADHLLSTFVFPRRSLLLEVLLLRLAVCCIFSGSGAGVCVSSSPLDPLTHRTDQIDHLQIIDDLDLAE